MRKDVRNGVNKNAQNGPQCVMLERCLSKCSISTAGPSADISFPCEVYVEAPAFCGKSWNAAQLLLGRPWVRFLWGVNQRMERFAEALLEMLCAPCLKCRGEVVCLCTHVCICIYLYTCVPHSACMCIFAWLLELCCFVAGVRLPCAAGKTILGMTQSAVGTFETHL